MPTSLRAKQNKLDKEKNGHYELILRYQNKKDIDNLQ